MLSGYYKLWVDAITSQKAKKDSEVNWKAYTIIPISILMGLNLLTLLYWLNKLTHHELPILMTAGIFHLRLINIFISVIIMFFVPFLIFNYLMIFYNNRYEELIKIYDDHNGKLYRNYALISLGILALPFILMFLF